MSNQFRCQWNYKNFIILAIFFSLGIDELLQPVDSFTIPRHKNPFAINHYSSKLGTTDVFPMSYMSSSMRTCSPRAQERPGGRLFKNALNLVATSSSSDEDNSSNINDNNTPSIASKRKSSSTASNKITSKKRGALQWNGTRSQINKASPSGTAARNFDNLNNIRSSPIDSVPMPILGYDGEAIMEYYDRRPLEVGWRLNSLGIPMVGSFRPGSFSYCSPVT